MCCVFDRSRLASDSLPTNEPTKIIESFFIGSFWITVALPPPPRSFRAVAGLVSIELLSTCFQKERSSGLESEMNSTDPARRRLTRQVQRVEAAGSTNRRGFDRATVIDRSTNKITRSSTVFSFLFLPVLADLSLSLHSADAIQYANFYAHIYIHIYIISSQQHVIKSDALFSFCPTETLWKTKSRRFFLSLSLRIFLRHYISLSSFLFLSRSFPFARFHSLSLSLNILSIFSSFVKIFLFTIFCFFFTSLT